MKQVLVSHPRTVPATTERMASHVGLTCSLIWTTKGWSIPYKIKQALKSYGHHIKTVFLDLEKLKLLGDL